MTKKDLRKVFFLSLVFIFFIINFNFIQAQEDEDIVLVKQLTAFDIQRPCFNNGSFCSPTATCNITITRPDGNSLLVGQPMNNKITYFNRTLSKSETTSLGYYPSIMVCADGSVSGEDTFRLLVTPSGFDDNSTGQLILLSFMGILSLGMIMWGFHIQDGWVVMFGAMLMFVGGLYTLLYGVANYRNTITEWGSIITLSIAGYISFRAALELMDGK